MLLEVNGVTKKFGGLTVLKQVSLGIQPGEIIGLIGPNGAGKSTLLNVIAGVYRPTEGEVKFKGLRVSGMPPEKICHQGIARTFQIPRPFSKLTAFQNVLVAATFGSTQSGEKPAVAAREALDFVGFPVSHQTLAANLTTAQLRRLDLARALASRPQLLLMDETAAGLTPNELTELQQLVFMVRDQGTTILIVEHLMRLIMQLCDRIAVLQYGEKIAEGTPEEIAADKHVTNAYLGEKYLI